MLAAVTVVLARPVLGISGFVLCREKRLIEKVKESQIHAVDTRRDGGILAQSFLALFASFFLSFSFYSVGLSARACRPSPAVASRRRCWLPRPAVIHWPLTFTHLLKRVLQMISQSSSSGTGPEEVSRGQAALRTKEYSNNIGFHHSYEHQHQRTEASNPTHMAQRNSGRKSTTLLIFQGQASEPCMQI